MARPYYDLPSWQKTQVSDSILDQIIKNRNFHLRTLYSLTEQTINFNFNSIKNLTFEEALNL